MILNLLLKPLGEVADEIIDATKSAKQYKWKWKIIPVDAVADSALAVALYRAPFGGKR